MKTKHAWPLWMVAQGNERSIAAASRTPANDNASLCNDIACGRRADVTYDWAGVTEPIPSCLYHAESARRCCEQLGLSFLMTKILTLVAH